MILIRTAIDSVNAQGVAGDNHQANDHDDPDNEAQKSKSKDEQIRTLTLKNSELTNQLDAKDLRIDYLEATLNAENVGPRAENIGLRETLDAESRLASQFNRDKITELRHQNIENESLAAELVTVKDKADEYRKLAKQSNEAKDEALKVA